MVIKKKKKETKETPPSAGLAYDNDTDSGTETPPESDTSGSKDVTAMLATAMNLVQGNEVLRDAIADAIETAYSLDNYSIL